MTNSTGAPEVSRDEREGEDEKKSSCSSQHTHAHTHTPLDHYNNKAAT